MPDDQEEAGLPMNPYIVRRNCEYSIAIVAPDEERAAITASHIPDSEWDKAWSDFEVERAKERFDGQDKGQAG